MKSFCVALIVLVAAKNVAGRLNSPSSIPVDSTMRSRLLKAKKNKSAKRRKKYTKYSNSSKSSKSSKSCKSSKSSKSCKSSRSRDPKDDENKWIENVTGKTLYTNDFENPKLQVDVIRPGCPIDTSKTINDQYGTDDNQFRQTRTTEVVTLTGQQCTADEPYKATSQKGGKYSIGINLGPSDGDRTALAFSAGTYKYVNIKMDLSTLGLPSCENSHPVDVDPQIDIFAYDSPQLEPILDGTLLDKKILNGVKGPDRCTIDWYTRTACLDVSNSSSGNVSVVWDGVDVTLDNEKRYTLIDNLCIVASDRCDIFPNNGICKVS